jgi:5-methylcytosine-specific restriction protein A
MNKPLKPCRHNGCNTLTSNSYCEVHKEQHKRNAKPRLSPSVRGYTKQWDRESKQFLTEHPWCVECEKHNKREPATETDHIIPHKGNMTLFWDKRNWQGLCHWCHSQKTAKEDGGFGNARRS